MSSLMSTNILTSGPLKTPPRKSTPYSGSFYFGERAPVHAWYMRWRRPRLELSRLRLRASPSRASACTLLPPCRPLLPCSALPRSLPSGLLRDIPSHPPVQHPHCPSGRVQPLVLLYTIIHSPAAIVRPVASCHPLGRALLLLPSASIHRPSRSDLPLSPALLNPASAVPLTDDRASVELANLPCAPPRPLQRCAYCKTVCQHSQRIDPSLGRWRRPHRDCLDFRATPTALHSLLTTHATRPVLHAGLAV